MSCDAFSVVVYLKIGLVDERKPIWVGLVSEGPKSIDGSVDNLQHQQLFGALRVAWASKRSSLVGTLKELRQSFGTAVRGVITDRTAGGKRHQESPPNCYKSWDVHPFNRFNMQTSNNSNNPTSLSQITGWFPSKVM